jgi:hypothetical protein
MAASVILEQGIILIVMGDVADMEKAKRVC